MSALTDLAEAAGVAPRWQNFRSEWQEVGEDALRTVLTTVGWPAGTDADVEASRERLAGLQAELPPLVTALQSTPIVLPVTPGRYVLTLESGKRQEGVLEARLGEAALPAIAETGYHRLELDGRTATIAVAPRSGHTADGMGRPWAIAVQMYALRRAGDAGLGDFRALGAFAAAAAAHGAAGVAISPVHAQFSADPDRFSPYSPSSRAALNVLHAPQDWPDSADARALEARPLVDWPAASRLRLAALRDAFERAGADELDRFARFRAEQGDALETHARFEALHAEQFGTHRRWHWRTWPEQFRRPDDPAVAAFARTHEREVAFHAYMQWRADQGLAAAQCQARDAGMAIGLIADLAVGADSGGSHGWSRQEQMLLHGSIGAPPDLLSSGGQNWGLAPFSPAGLRAHGYAAFLEMLRAAMRHAGGVRIDHALGLRRLWIVPDGASARDGAYLAFPQTDLLRLIALESQRNRAIVLGEDLGTIPPGFQDEMAESGLLGMRVLWFERKDERFLPPSTWSRTAAAMTSTHDLPTTSGWWRGRDLAWRTELDLAGGPDRLAQEGHERFRDRFALWRAMQESGAATGDKPPDDEPARFVDAALRHVAGSACDLAIIPIEDILGLDEQPNLPGTMDDQHPNWQRRLPGAADQLLEQPPAAARLAAIDEARSA